MNTFREKLYSVIIFFLRLKRKKDNKGRFTY